MDDAVRHAARSIQRRNVGSGNTNTSILGTYVTLVAAETYDLPGLREYATARLRRLHAYTKEQGAFTEYNSPTYTMVSLTALAELRAHVKDPEARRLKDLRLRFEFGGAAEGIKPPAAGRAGRWASAPAAAWPSGCRRRSHNSATCGASGR